MEEKKKTNIKLTVCIIIIILLVIALGVISYLGFNNKNNNLNSNTTTTIEKPNNQNHHTIPPVENKNKKDVKIEKFLDYKYKLKDENAYFEVHIPKVIGNGYHLKTLNDKILIDTLNEYTSHIECNLKYKKEMECFNKGSIINYKHLIQNNILVISFNIDVPKNAIGWYADGYYHYSYYYDIKNDKLLKVSEAAEKLQIPLPKDACNGSLSSYKDLDTKECSTISIDNGNHLQLEFNCSGCKEYN